MNHLVIVTTSFPDSYFQKGQEAAGSFVYDFALECASYVPVTVVTPSKKRAVETAGNLTIHRFPVPSMPLSLLKPTNPLNWFKIVKTIQSGEAAVRQAVKNQPADHIFALWALPSGYWARKVGREFNVPYSVWALGSDIWGLGKVPLVRIVLRRVLQESQYCFADGYRLAEEVTAISGVNCEFLPSSRQLLVEGSKKLAEHPPYKLVFLGRWHPNKGIDLLLESLTLLEDADWQKIEEVRIFGGGPMEGQVKRRCGEMKHAGRPVTIGGYLDRKEATDLLLWADYLLLPSRIESIPVIFSDAMQTGCPIISMPIGDLPRLIQEYGCGIMAENITAVDFKRSIQKIGEYPPIFFQDNLSCARKKFDLELAVENLLTRF